MIENTPPRFAQVILMAPVYADYTYAVPPEMAARLRPGCRVVVPMGGGHTNGVVRSFREVPPDGVKIKPILDLIDEEPLVDQPRLELAGWVARYYFAPPGECVRLFFPPGTYVDTTFAYAATAAGKSSLAEGAPDGFQGKLLALIAQHDGITRKAIAQLIPFRGLDRSLAILERRGLIQRESRVLGARTGFRKVNFIEPTAAEVDPSKFPARQRDLLTFLFSHERPQPLARAVEESRVTHAVARALEKKNLVRIFTAETSRDPFSGYDKVELEALTLTAAQAAAIERVRTGMRAGRPGRFLILGVTGSGKTQVYIELIKEALGLGRTALMLVPEIALTPALTRRFLAHFGPRLSILHSMLSDGERHDQWFRIHRGEAQVVIGTRSALFAPLGRLGLIVLDEEHDASYKQDESPRYHCREVARRWAASCGAALVLGSATPSVESFHAATAGGDLELLELPERIQKRPLPVVNIIDLALEFDRHGKNVILSGVANRALAECLTRREQVMILLNRRGFAPVLLCRKCGEAALCAHCSISLTYHHAEERLLCHYCGYVRDVPSVCPECGSKYLFYLGLGTEKLEELFRQRFPGRRIARFDRDTTRQRGQMKEILDRFERREIDLLVGTQMIAKGHDFPGVTLVLVLSTDISLRIPDFRSAERTFQLLTQVAGRSGRGDTPGEVYIQTYYPSHYAVRHARTQDYRQFFEAEIKFRRQLFYPPFTHLVHIEIGDPKETVVRQTAEKAGRLLREMIADRGLTQQLRVLGPAPALLEKIKDKHRWSILLRCFDIDRLPEALHDFRQRCTAARLPLRSITIDVDPESIV